MQTYAVTILDSHGASTVQDVSVAINGVNDAPTAVSETVITDVGAGGIVNIPAWALALNDTDPDTTDHVGLGSVTASSGGSVVVTPGQVSFTDDTTLGGSFNYTASDGIATSANTATDTVVNNAISATSLTAGSGDSVLVAQGTEQLVGGAGNDVLIGTASGNVMSGGGGNDTFAFLQTPTPTAPGQITDFNNTTQHDRIAISANSFGGGLTAGMDVTPTFETSADNSFSGAAEFHFDTGNHTLYFSADGTQASAHAIVAVQASAVINPHDILLV